MKRIRNSKHQATLNLPTIQLEGSLFLPDQLEKAAQSRAQGQTEVDYGVPKGVKLKDEYSRAFQIACAQWQHFAAQLDRADVDAHRLTIGFVSELLRDALGYTPVQPTTSVQVAAMAYPVNVMAGRMAVLVAPHNLALDDADPRFAVAGSGNRKKSAFQAMQELLNASPEHTWGIVSNGKQLRLLRDAASLTRPTYLEFDLADLLGGQRYAEFASVWRLLHGSRAPQSGGAACVWEQWREAGKAEGTRVRDGLRNGVEKALLTFGEGFLQHPTNDALRAALHDGSLSKDAYFQQLLRLIYRLIFVFTVEERGVLHPVDDSAEALAARKAYSAGYALSRLRELCLKRRARNRHDDHWQVIRIVWRGLAHGQSRLALPALGGLFAEDQCPHLDTASLHNTYMLAALQHLRWAVIAQGKTSSLTPVDYRNMGPEELGSVYESLLELTPTINLPARSFGFLGVTGEGSAAGNQRKTSGSYYTPDNLVQELIRTALDPLIDQQLAKHPDGPIEALLSLSVVDPSCGSGHFLLAAARRIAEKLAVLESPDGAITPQGYRHALREVVANCVYGVDRNPMAIELCKVALWLESVEPGRPLGFLDAHVRCGDALLGVHDLSVLRAGIPNEAFAPLKDVLADTGISGQSVDNREAGSALRRRNIGERAQPTLPLAGLNLGIPDELDAVLARLSRDDDGLSDVEAKRQLYEHARADGTLTWRLLRACDLWTAAFFNVKQPVERQGREHTPTSDTVWRFLGDPTSLASHVAEETEALRQQYRFFHWPLEFPEVFKRGGFSLVLGNPPWETMSPDAKEFFAKHEPVIASMAPSQQQARIAELLTTPVIRHEWERHARELYAAVRFIKDSGRYRMFAAGNLGKGDFNVYRQFVELALTFAASDGFAAQIVPENFYNGANASAIRAALFGEFRLTTLFGFENTRGVWFQDIDTRMKFALYCAQRGGVTSEFPAAFSINSEDRLQVARERPLHLPVALLREFSPEAIAVMEFSNQLEIDIARKMYARFPRLGDEIEGLPTWVPATEIHMGNDNELFTMDTRGWPLYQGSMVTHHDYRAKGYVSGHGRNVTWEPLTFGTEEKCIRPQWRIVPEKIPNKIHDRVRRYRIGFCDVGNSTNQRALMAAMIPPNTVCGHKVPTIEFEPSSPAIMLLWLAVGNTLAMDFIVRMKVALTMSLSILASLPFPRTVATGSAAARACALAARLSCAGAEMEGLVEELAKTPELAGQDITPAHDPAERAQLSAELDIIVARNLFGLTREEVQYLLEPRDVLGPDCTAETFAALRRAEEREHGEYRTKRLVLREFDRMDLAEASGEPYGALLSPLPGAQATRSYSAHGVIRDEADAHLAGLLLTIIQQAGRMPRRELTQALTLAGRADLQGRFVDTQGVARLRAFEQTHPGVFDSARLPGDRMHQWTRHFEATGVIRLHAATDLIERIQTVALPAYALVTAETAPVATVLVQAATRAFAGMTAADEGTAATAPSIKQA
ncbi:N-6 DNA methylase [Herbaspirillum sp. C7C2]|uniref:Eco57I restriction-modification methylase domain-containing protein n=1 Tax=Herbaspirillum sp. C7C2 TaxID=2736666 RepID=UPI001F51C7E1|nr:N-6 DNA methylase [Herbaspirillum sp. C7C2]MCI1016447.1 N-6 DNA methylase [Herbaspirillum sp. C7C2]